MFYTIIIYSIYFDSIISYSVFAIPNQINTNKRIKFDRNNSNN